MERLVKIVKGFQSQKAQFKMFESTGLSKHLRYILNLKKTLLKKLTGEVTTPIANRVKYDFSRLINDN